MRGIANALRKAKRVRLGFEKSADSLDGMSLIINTEAIRYKWRGADGQFPDYEKLIPAEFNTVAHFDTVEAVKAISSLKVLADSKSYPIDLYLDNGYITAKTNTRRLRLRCYKKPEFDHRTLNLVVASQTVDTQISSLIQQGIDKVLQEN